MWCARCATTAISSRGGDLSRAAKFADQCGALSARRSLPQRRVRWSCILSMTGLTIRFADAFAERLTRDARRRSARRLGAPVPVLFTAHSVPLPDGDLSAAGESGQPARSARSLCGSDAKLTARWWRAVLPGSAPDDWFFAFQSQGMSGGPWLGPTVEDTLTALRAAGRDAPDHSAHRVFVRPRRDSVRHRHWVSEFCGEAGHRGAPAAVAERFAAAHAGAG